MNNTERLWKEISVAALLGTQRRPFQPELASGDLGAVLTTSPDVESERVLLRAAAITALHRRAGRLPALAEPAFPPACPADEWPRCSPQAGMILDQILGGGRSTLLSEWVMAAANHRQRCREEYLPWLLDQQKILQTIPRPVLLAVLGERGRWLAAQNPEWNAYVAYPDETIWHEGQRKQRLAYLTDLRAKDPAQARALLEATWGQESPAERTAFLSVLSQALSMADEPFLETALDDRYKDVRQTAASLLARLPQSRLSKRMTGRATRLLGWKSGLLRSTLTVVLPEECDAAMQRDGISARVPAGIKLGEKAFWLAQILASVPPTTWSTAWNRRPDQIVEAVHKHEWQEALLEGFSKAAVLHQDEEWLEACVNYHYMRNNSTALNALFAELSNQTKERWMSALLRDNPSLSYDQPASSLLALCTFEWSTEMTQAVTTVICWTLQRGDLQPWRWERLLRDVGPYFHAGSLEPTIQRMAVALQKKSNGDSSVAGLLGTLEFRLALHRAFHS